MRAESPQAVWLSWARQRAEELRDAPGNGPARIARFFDAASDGEHLAAAFLWQQEAPGRFQLVASGGVSRLVAAGGRLLLEGGHMDAVRAAFQSGTVSTAEWSTPAGTDVRIVRRRVDWAAGRTVVLELAFPAAAPHDPEWQTLVCSEIGALLSRLDAAPVPAPAAAADPFWEPFSAFVLSLQQSLSVSAVAQVAANDGRVLLECDRISVALRTGSSCRVAAVSGQESLQNRANLVRRLATLAREASRYGEPVLYEGTLDGFPSFLADPLAGFLEESRSRMVTILPLRKNVPHERIEQDLVDRRRPPAGEVIGCLVLEQFSESAPTDLVRARGVLVAEQVAAALSNARDHETIFLLPLWKAVGRACRWGRGRRLALAGAVCALLALVGGALAFVPWEYRVEARGQAMPAVQHEIFAPWDGIVVDVSAENGQTVERGTVLAVLRSDDLETELLEAENVVREKQKQIESLGQQRERAGARGNEEEALRLAGELRKVEIELEGTRLRRAKVLSRKEGLVVRSPANGCVATFQTRQNLLDRPVKRGDLLLQIMDVDGPWRLELDVPEYRMGHLLEAHRGPGTAPAAPVPPVEVEFVAATAVTQVKRGALSAIGSRSNESQEKGSVVEVFVEIVPNDLPGRRIGAEVTARLHCGPRSLGYVLFGDLLEFVQRKLWW
ncbi:biotin/lipoyl-binding protein [Planctomyces sp. SH-PL14]|uniref:biotin/lipoyl-binding protein n=1 Tax=Planctomyces sp. SH-PL14 TaxID=1632864 RepID=UPI00078B4F20|nr:biotin/lipoyl-binding protein [Planctomyces sp. SH-PL14]AMV18028.1 hypothetical protein VT03_09070 [Planctomyces sp. SH-PL14]